MSNFHIGQRVVCVDDKVRPWKEWRDGAPVKNDVYTISEIVQYCGETCLSFADLSRKSRQPYRAIRFKPICTTDISIFTAMLAPTPRVKKPTFAEHAGNK